MTAVDSEEAVIPESEYKKAMARIKQLEPAQGKSTMKVEILTEAVRITREKKLISRAPLPGIEVDFIMRRICEALEVVRSSVIERLVESAVLEEKSAPVSVLGQFFHVNLVLVVVRRIQACPKQSPQLPEHRRRIYLQNLWSPTNRKNSDNFQLIVSQIECIQIDVLKVLDLPDKRITPSQI